MQRQAQHHTNEKSIIFILRGGSLCFPNYLENGGDLLRCYGDIVVSQDEGGVDTGEFRVGHFKFCWLVLVQVAI